MQIAPRFQEWVARTSWPDRLGLSGLYLFAFFALLGTAGANLGIGLMLAGLLIDPHARQRLAREPLTWLAAVSVLLMLVNLWTAWTDGPATAAHHLEAAKKLLQLWLFLLCGWHFGARPERIGWALALTLTGFILGRLVHPDMLRTATAAFRPGYGLPALAFAEYCAIGVLSLLLCQRRWWAAGNVARVGAVAALALLAFWLIESQGRMAWLTLTVFAPTLLVAQAWLADSQRSRRNWLVSGGVALLLIASATQIELVRERLAWEAEVVSRVVAGEWGDIGYGPIGVRLHMLAYGVERWLERPWLGWGPGALPGLLSVHPEAQLHYQDLHNLYLEMLVRLGILGSLPFASGLALALVAAAAAVRQRRLPTDLALILLGGLGMHLVLAIANMRGLNVDWRYIWMLFGGAAASFALFPRAVGRGARPPTAQPAPGR